MSLCVISYILRLSRPTARVNSHHVRSTDHDGRPKKRAKGGEIGSRHEQCSRRKGEGKGVRVRVKGHLFVPPKAICHIGKERRVGWLVVYGTLHTEGQSNSL